MLTPDYLQALPDALVALWQQVEDDILRDVARRIGKMDGLTDTAAWQLWRLQQTRALRMDTVKLLAKYSGKSEAEIRRLLQQAGTDTLAADDDAYRAMGLQPVPVNESAVLLNLLNAGYRQTVGSWKNLTATTANTVTKQFEDALDRAWLQVSSGAFDYKTSIRQAVNELAREMKYIEYPSGHRDTLEVAVRRAVLTGVNQTGLQLQAARMDEMVQQGFENFVEVTAHTGARTDGSGGPAEGVTWQGKHYTGYEATQKQRQIERSIRAQKNRILVAEATGDAKQLQTAQIRLRQLGLQYDVFSKGVGLRTQEQRLWVSGFSKGKNETAGYFEDSPHFLYDDQLRYLDHEELLVYTSDGKFLFKKIGTANRVSFSQEEAQLLDGAYTSHNHPSGGPPSPADIYMLYKHHIASVHVSTHTHGVFVIDQPSTWKKTPASVQEMNSEAYAFANRFQKQILRRIDAGSITPEEGEYLIQRLAMRRLCRKYGVRMELHEWNDPSTSKITE